MKLSAFPDISLPLLVAFITLVFMTGGGARWDILSLAILRPAAIGMVGYALYRYGWPTSGSVAISSGALAAIAGIGLVQLIPLPPQVWGSLPGRDEMRTISAIMGMEQLWRPMTLSPARTINSVASLSVPLAIILWLPKIERQNRPKVLLAIAIIATLSMIAGMLQILMGQSSPFYFYENSNRDSATGLFSNRNHHSVFLATLVPFAFVFIRQSVQNTTNHWYRAAALIFLTLLILMIPATGSRAGVAIGLLAFGASVWLTRDLWGRLGMHRSANPQIARAWAVAMLFIVVTVVSTLAIAVYNGRITSVERFYTEGYGSEIRIQQLPYIYQMTKDFFPFGVGLGAFELAYYKFEPEKSIGSPYMNHVHNDWLQIVVEMGGLGLIVLAFIIYMYTKFIAELFKRWNSCTEDAFLMTAALISITSLGLASIFDYPIRVPSIMAWAAILVVIMIDPKGWLGPSPMKGRRR
ncbi:O-antigen ligase family protein [Blastomonas sp.]|uniref:O-antigen ligase family protein n=1 Tax=Blastomonas sp. TaxID=1909299 RepID=UPI0017A6C4B4|nr:O-antigen ligase family protein [Blastomonas sp.]